MLLLYLWCHCYAVSYLDKQTCLCILNISKEKSTKLMRELATTKKKGTTWWLNSNIMAAHINRRRERIHTHINKKMNSMKKGFLSTWTLTRDHFSSHSFSLFTSLAELDSPHWQWPGGDIKSDIFLVEVAGLHWYEATDSAAWLEASLVALIAWERTEKPVGVIKKVIKRLRKWVIWSCW